MNSKISYKVSNTNPLIREIINIGPPADNPYTEILRQTEMIKEVDEILFITSYPPRECGIATYSRDLIKSLNNKFSKSFSIRVCALEAGNSNFKYPDVVKLVLNTNESIHYERIASSINKDKKIKIVVIQHEFGFFKNQENAFLKLLGEISKPVIIVFHTVLPSPDPELKSKINIISKFCESIIVMTHRSAEILITDYSVPERMISVIPHGTHLVKHQNKKSLKLKYDLKGLKVLTTFGLLSSGKNIETTLEALPSIIKACPEVMFLIIGKTHPEVVKSEGEKYREKLEKLVILNKVDNHVKFINDYIALPELLEYLQLTDIYLFTTNDPNQAVSGTFVYAMSCACPIISTPIPHAKELLTEDLGVIIDFGDSDRLAKAAISLLNNEPLRRNKSSNTLQKIVSTAWENSAVNHALLIEKISGGNIKLNYNLPELKLDHIIRMTTGIGIIQFSKKNQPDLDTGYTLDDNARAMVAMCMHFKLTANKKDVNYISRYLSFIKFCLQPGGNFLNFVSREGEFTDQNYETNLDDANGRAVWALGYLISLNELLPGNIIHEAKIIFDKSITRFKEVHSTRSMAFAIKGIYYYHEIYKSPKNITLLNTFAHRLVQMYKHESTKTWQWFESYLTYANSILPEAMLYAWLITGEQVFKEIAISSFRFLLLQTFNINGIEVISNKNWFVKGETPGRYGEQPIDVAYTIMTLSQFYKVFEDEEYQIKLKIAFNWFLGNNRLHNTIYNPCTGGCYDGLEETHVNLNQGAESTVSYLIARLTVDENEKPKHRFEQALVRIDKKANMFVPILKNTGSLNPYYFITNATGITTKRNFHGEI